MKGFEPQLSIIKDTKNIKVAIVYTSWNTEYINQLVDTCRQELILQGVQQIVCHQVPGSWELPFKIKRIGNVYDVIISIGVLIKGDTKHFEYISKTVFQGLMDVQFQINRPVINGVLTVLSEDQIEERISLAKGWAQSAVMMC